MKKYSVIIQGILKILVPVVFMLVVLLTTIRVMMTPLVVRLEYHTPQFPADIYGFTEQERIEYGVTGLKYLFNQEDISYLGDLTFEDGSPLFNQRELDHMLDVKVLTQVGINVYYIILAVFVGLLIWAVRGGWWQDFKQLLGIGGRLTCFFLVFLVVGIALSFEAVFTGFHRIFFDGDTWLFYYTDTLIRLYPMRFWRDLFAAMGILALLVSGVSWWRFLGRKK